MTKIKFCGIKRLEDIAYINKLKPEYAGFIFAKSKRRVSKELAKELLEKIDKRIKTVGVFQDEDITIVKSIKDELNLDILQFHGDESKEYLKEFKKEEIWKAIGIEYEKDLLKIKEYEKVSSKILLDSKIFGISGGLGKTFNWDYLNNIKSKENIIIAGGINKDNILPLIHKINPSIIDISSGIEIDGVKDFKKMEEIILKVRNNNGR